MFLSETCRVFPKLWDFLFLPVHCVLLFFVRCVPVFQPEILAYQVKAFTLFSLIHLSLLKSSWKDGCRNCMNGETKGPVDMLGTPEG